MPGAPARGLSAPFSGRCATAALQAEKPTLGTARARPLRLGLGLRRGELGEELALPSLRAEETLAKGMDGILRRGVCPGPCRLLASGPGAVGSGKEGGAEEAADTVVQDLSVVRHSGLLCLDAYRFRPGLGGQARDAIGVNEALAGCGKPAKSAARVRLDFRCNH